MIFTGNKDVDVEILLLLNLNDLNSVRNCSIEVYKLCKYDIMLKNKITNIDKEVKRLMAMLDQYCELSLPTNQDYAVFCELFSKSSWPLPGINKKIDYIILKRSTYSTFYDLAFKFADESYKHLVMGKNILYHILTYMIYDQLVQYHF